MRIYNITNSKKIYQTAIIISFRDYYSYWHKFLSIVDSWAFSAVAGLKLILDPCLIICYPINTRVRRE